MMPTMQTIKSLALAEPATLTEEELDYVTGGDFSLNGNQQTGNNTIASNQNSSTTSGNNSRK